MNQVLRDIVSPEAKVGDDALGAQDADLGRFGHFE